MLLVFLAGAGPAFAQTTRMLYTDSTGTNIGIGTTTPQAAFVVTNGNVGIGTWAPGAALIVQNGNVGIGTWSPTSLAKLHVYGLNGSITGNGLTYIENTDDADALVIKNSGNSTQNDRAVFQARVGSTTVLRVNNSGNVGIGTTGPNSPLHVFATNAKSSTGFWHTSITDSTALAAGIGGGLQFWGRTTDVPAYESYGGIQGYKANATSNNRAGQLRFSTQLDGSGLVTRMTIDESGNVGIGTTNPAYGKLQLHMGTDSNIAFRDQGGVPRIEAVNDAVTGDVPLQILGNPLVLNPTTGNVGIGTTGPGTKLDVNGALTVNSNYIYLSGANDANHAIIHYDNNAVGSYTNGEQIRFYDYLDFYTTSGASHVMVLNSSGNVGIGTTNPLSILHVRSASGTAAHVRIDSGGASDEAQIGFYINGVLKWQQSQQTAGNIIWYDGSDNQILFRADASAQNDDGWETAAVDYAEWMKKMDSNEEILPFEVVGIKNGKVTKDTNDAAFYMLTSSKSGIRGGNPIDTPRDNDTEWVVVAYTGQVPVLLKGEFKEGDYVIPSGRNDGLAVAVPPENVQPDQYKQVIGRVLNEFNYEFSKTSDGGFEVELRNLMSRKGSNKIVNVAVGTSSGVTIFDKRYDEKIKKLEMENDRLQVRLTALESKVK